MTTMKMLGLDGSVSPPEFELPGSVQPPPILSLSPKRDVWKPITMGDINVNLALRCPICQDPYQEPKQLNCGHSFCLTCLEGSQHLYSINCPICRKATCFSLPGLNGLRLLPNNYALAQVIEAVTCVRKDDPEVDSGVDDGDSDSANGDQTKHACDECPQCHRVVASAKMWYCADCERGGQKFCSNCMIERHRGSHRCVNMADMEERWRINASKLDTLKTRLTPLRAVLRQVACNMKNIALSKADELEKRSEFLCKQNKLIEDLLVKADAASSGPADCQRLIDLECLIKKLETSVSIYGIRLTTLKEITDEATNLLNKAIDHVNELEKNIMENEEKSSTDNLENVVVAWHEPGAKSVSLAGSFTVWKPSVRLVEYKGEFLATLQLPKGRHEFKFLVDNEWKQSYDYESCEDGCGGRNNYITV